MPERSAVRHRVRLATRMLLAAAVAGAVLPADGGLSLAAGSRPARADLGPLRVSENGRYLTEPGGTPFFWLGDTAWRLFLDLDRPAAERYLDARAEQGFTVIQATAVLAKTGVQGPNAYGDQALAGGLSPVITDGADPADDEQYDYWDHVDFVVDQAAQRGMRVALVPVWAYSNAGSLVTTSNARQYGRFLGERYGDDVVWVLGGDFGAGGVEEVWRELAAGVAIGANGSEDYADLLMTYHPPGDGISATWFHDDDWLSFNMIQGGHCRRWAGLFRFIDSSFSKTPPKPFIEGGSGYEDHPICYRPEDGYATEEDVRRNAYWSVFSGAAGHTYGHHAVWQFLEEGKRAALGARGSWIAALDSPGAGQMRHLRALMESRPYLTRLPDQAILGPGGLDFSANSIRATRDAEGSYLMVYTPGGNKLSVTTTVLSGAALRHWWFDPRTGEVIDAGSAERGASVDFFPPETGRADAGRDWVLVVDDAARGFGPPGPPFAT